MKEHQFFFPTSHISHQKNSAAIPKQLTGQLTRNRVVRSISTAEDKEGTVVSERHSAVPIATFAVLPSEY